MDVSLPEAERQLLWQAQRTCWGKAGYVSVTVPLMLDYGRAVAAIAEDLGLDEATVYDYTQTCRLQVLTGYLRAEQPGYWGLLTSAQLAGLGRILDAELVVTGDNLAQLAERTVGEHGRPATRRRVDTDGLRLGLQRITAQDLSTGSRDRLGEGSMLLHHRGPLLLRHLGRIPLGFDDEHHVLFCHGGHLSSSGSNRNQSCRNATNSTPRFRHPGSSSSGDTPRETARS